jgi:hypothetical protein
LLPSDAAAKLMDQKGESSQWLSVYYPRGGQMRVRGPKGELPYSIPHNNFPSKIFVEGQKIDNEIFLWPPLSTLQFYTHPPKRNIFTHDRQFDLSDNLTAGVTPKRGIKCFFGISTLSKDWDIWSEKNLKKIEKHIRYDLNFDGFSVQIERFTDPICKSTKKKNISCENEFIWRLSIYA